MVCDSVSVYRSDHARPHIVPRLIDMPRPWRRRAVTLRRPVPVAARTGWHNDHYGRNRAPARLTRRPISHGRSSERLAFWAVSPVRRPDHGGRGPCCLGTHPSVQPEVPPLLRAPPATPHNIPTPPLPLSHRPVPLPQ